MSQGSTVLPTSGTVSGLTFAQDANAALDALLTNSAGATAPANGQGGAAEAYQLWADTSAQILKQRNAANNGWVPLLSLNGARVTAESGSFTAALGDFGNVFNCTAALTATLSAPASLIAGWYAYVLNTSAGNVTLAPAGGTIDGAASVVLSPGERCAVICDGANFLTLGRQRGLVLLASQTASNSAAIAFTSLIDNTFDQYEVEITDCFPSVSGAVLQMQFSENGGVSYKNSSYEFVNTKNDPTNGVQNISSSSASSFQMGPGLSNGGTAILSATIKLVHPAQSVTNKNIRWQGEALSSGGFFNCFVGSGYYNGDQAAYNAIEFTMTGGSNIQGGTFRLYGKRSS